MRRLNLAEEILAAIHAEQPHPRIDLTRDSEDRYEITIENPEPEPEPEPQKPLDIEESVDNYTPTIESIQARNKDIVVRQETQRFSSAEWFDAVQNKTIIIAGIGGIGSWTALLLSRLFPKAIYLYDGDTVERVNMAGQLYGNKDIGKGKTAAIADTIREFSNYGYVYSTEQLYEKDSLTGDIMICGFDNMRARALFFAKWKQHVYSKEESKRKDCLFIDGRLSAEEYQIFSIHGNDTYHMNRYENEFLFQDYQAEHTVCSFKQTAFLANLIAGAIVNIYVNFCANECKGVFKRPVPFFTHYMYELMHMETSNA